MVYQMAFGNGGTNVDPTGIITYLSPNSTGTNASLYNQTYAKVIDNNNVNNVDPTRNKLETSSLNCLVDQDSYNSSAVLERDKISR